MQIPKMSLVFVLIAGIGLFLLSTIQVSAQPLTKDTPTGNLTGEVDISIDPAEPLPANGTATISTEGATDTDMNGFPPEGVYVIISNGAVLVTNQTVEIGTAEGEDVGTESEVGSNEETESVDGSDEGNGSDGDGSDEGNGSDGDGSDEGNGSDGDGFGDE